MKGIVFAGGVADATGIAYYHLHCGSHYRLMFFVRVVSEGTSLALDWHNFHLVPPAVCPYFEVNRKAGEGDRCRLAARAALALFIKCVRFAKAAPCPAVDASELEPDFAHVWAAIAHDRFVG
jgi:hypothetical protein